MVNWGTSDLVVRNDTDYPAKFVIHTYDNVLTCEIWGIQPDWYDYIEPISWYTSSSSANAQAHLLQRRRGGLYRMAAVFLLLVGEERSGGPS